MMDARCLLSGGGRGDIEFKSLGRLGSGAMTQSRGRAGEGCVEAGMVADCLLQDGNNEERRGKQDVPLAAEGRASF